MITDL